MQAEMGGSNFVEYSLDASGDLYLKYYFADTSIAKGSAVGDFNLDKEALAIADREAKGLPFSILPRQDLSIKGDWHSWSPKPNATFDDHVAFARQYAPGHIEAITPYSNLVSAAMADIKAHDGRLAVVKIDDKKVRDAYVANPSLIPRQVSPGFMNLEVPNQTNIKKVRWAHLAAVPKGAYGEKATLYASCIGGNECIDHLVAASVKEIDEKTRESYCAVGASQTISSLGNFSTDSNLMSDNANTVATTPPVVAPVSSTPPEKPKGAPITTGTPTKGIVRLKDKTQAVTQTGNQPEVTGEDELTKLRSEVQKMQEIQQQAARREEIKKLIPKDPYIKKGKFDEKAFEADVDKWLQRGESNEQIADHYNLLIERDNLLTLLTQSGLPLPNAIPNPQEGMQVPAAPTGGSSYQTPSDVPGEPTGGSASDYVTKSITELLRFTIRR
jgi:hypothetical protein